MRQASEIDHLIRLRAGMVRGEAAVLSRMPVLRRDYEVESPDHPARDGKRVIAVRDLQRAARQKVVLEINEDKRAHDSALYREAEAVLGEPIVLAAIEAIQPCGAMSYVLLHLVGLDDEIHREDLLAEVALVEIGAEDDLVEAL